MSDLRELGLRTDEEPPASLATRVVQGIGLALGLTIFRLLVGLLSGQPVSWPSAPLAALLVILLCLAGAIGGAVYFATEGWRRRGGWRKTTANVAALLAYCLFLFGALLFALAREG